MRTALCRTIDSATNGGIYLRTHHKEAIAPSSRGVVFSPSRMAKDNDRGGGDDDDDVGWCVDYAPRERCLKQAGSPGEFIQVPPLSETPRRKSQRVNSALTRFHCPREGVRRAWLALKIEHSSKSAKHTNVNLGTRPRSMNQA